MHALIRIKFFSVEYEASVGKRYLDVSEHLFGEKESPSCVQVEESKRINAMLYLSLALSFRYYFLSFLRSEQQQQQGKEENEKKQQEKSIINHFGDHKKRTHTPGTRKTFF